MKFLGLNFVLPAYLFVEVSAQFFIQNSGGCMSMMMCPLQCPAGYATDSMGCRICVCASPSGSSASVAGQSMPMNPGGDPFHQGGAQMSMGGVMHNMPTFSATYNKPCIDGTTCDLHCAEGYYNGPDGCQFCLCASIQTAQNQQGTSYSPCPGSAPTCDMHCQYGYQTESSGCQRCICASGSNQVSTTPQPTVSTTLSPDECLEKITECQLRYPFGFMTDDTCITCISKDDIYPAIISPERQPTIKLTNPCIQGFDVCRIFCATGYRTGPRSCQYCACNG